MHRISYVLAVALITALGGVAGCATEQENDDVAAISVGDANNPSAACAADQAIYSLEVKTSSEWTVWSDRFAAKTTIGHAWLSFCGAPGSNFNLSFTGDATLLAVNWRTGVPAVLRFTPAGGVAVLADGFSLTGGGGVKVTLP